MEAQKIHMEDIDLYVKQPHSMDIFRKGDPDWARQLKYLGYTKIGKLSPDVLQELKAESVKLINETRKKYPKGELFNLINCDYEVKTASNQMVDKYLNPYVRDIIDPEKADVFPVSHLVKPFGLRSDIWHQDSAIVDERVAFSLNAWTPLVNSTRYNGCLWIFPGSHINTNFTRQFGYNPVEKDLLKELKKYMVPVYAEAGEVLLFHRSIIHGSSRNWLPFSRLAVESVVVSKDVQFYNFHREEAWSKEKVFGFQVEMKHFLKPNPKDDFYDGTYPKVEFDDPGFEGITENLLSHVDQYQEYARKYYDGAV